VEILNYTEDHLKFRERVRSFFEKEVTPYVDEWEKTGITPKSIWKRMDRRAFFAPACRRVRRHGRRLPLLGHRFRRTGADRPDRARRTASQRRRGPLHHSFGSEELKKKYLPLCVSGDMITAIAMTEPTQGAILLIQTTAVEDATRW